MYFLGAFYTYQALSDAISRFYVRVWKLFGRFYAFFLLVLDSTIQIYGPDDLVPTKIAVHIWK